MNTWTPFEWITALRFLREGRMQTLFIVSGVAIGVAVIVFMSALLSGLQANFIKRVLTSSPHIQLIPPDEVARNLRGGPGVTIGAIIQRPAQRLLDRSVAENSHPASRLACNQQCVAHGFGSSPRRPWQRQPLDYDDRHRPGRVLQDR